MKSKGHNIRSDHFIKKINGVLLRLLEYANLQDVLSILLSMLNHYAAVKPIPQKIVTLLVKCLERALTHPIL